jgi:hypothetical protein
MNLELDKDEAEELHALLEVSLRELSHEIAATDNHSYRAELSDRREKLRRVTASVKEMLAPRPEVPDELVRELARPGD